ncbi:hypothetical protein CQ017_14390 [Arthrobacter sp. MYb224]|uniref:hypothetical protein n=1 Tax=unclassified Arthrobacter TaxID=235627 RepID=UPI000CFDA311|nr:MULTISPECIES: hypothetical protein [unclassified Arthrobacter]PQZ97106.1 hypothetical protein CQ017_14390 [Arthrobacter sp. MYb224]PRA00032.1 hypothetical protein CQ019_16135 [Arthrobacter sp. MYb229]PRB48294.1 hypothetical protein CQ013_15130 [Arthrobacter sp. MYb216]
MRKVISVIAILLGAVALVVGIGQKTFWAPPETVTASMPEFESEAPLTVIQPSVQNANAEPVELVISGDGEFTASLARSYDVEAWVDNASHVELTGVDRENHQLVAELIDGEKKTPNPAGDDLFFDSQKADGTMTYRWTAPDNGDWSLLLAADGTKAAPTDISVTYANDDAMPWALPLIIIGALLLVFGVALLLMRVIKPSKPARRGEAASPSAKGGSTTQNSLAMAAVLALAVGGVSVPMAPSEDKPAESAKASDSAKSEESEKAEESKPADDSKPADESTSAEAEPDSYPVLTEEQLQRILGDVEKQIGKADEKNTKKDLDARTSGAFKDLRTKRYDILNDDIKIAKPLALKTAVIRSAAVPNSSEAKFPRVISVVTAKDSDPATLPMALTLKQDSARENYKVSFAAQMLPNSTFPGIAVGDPSIQQLGSNAEGLKVKPEEALDQLADVLTNEKSKHKGNFAESEFIKAIHSGQKKEKEEANEANVKYSRSVNKKDTQVISTPDGGAIVTGRLNQKAVFERTEDADPLESADELTKKLLGSSTSTGNVEITYAEPVMMYIPASGNDDKIQLVASEVVLLSVKQAEEN